MMRCRDRGIDRHWSISGERSAAKQEWLSSGTTIGNRPNVALMKRESVYRVDPPSKVWLAITVFIAEPKKALQDDGDVKSVVFEPASIL